jgi:hypothetical protein
MGRRRTIVWRNERDTGKFRGDEGMKVVEE